MKTQRDRDAAGVTSGRLPTDVPVDQAWFWTDRWQRREREADADIAAGRMTTLDGLDGLLDHLDKLADEGENDG